LQKRVRTITRGIIKVFSIKIFTFAKANGTDRGDTKSPLLLYCMKEKLLEIIREFTESTHLYLVELKINGQVIDISLDGDCGITINECADLNRFIHRRLEEQGIDIGNYIVEVASPGIDRPLTEIRDYKKNVGRKLQVRNNQNKIISGKLSYVDNEKIMLTGSGNKKPEIVELKTIKEAKTVI
jgi:ribosome maturation factor RimP